MIYEEKLFRLPGCRECVLRTPRPQDALEMLDYLTQVSGETEYMLRYPEEITLTVPQEEMLLRTQADSTDMLMIAAFVDDNLAGNIGIGPETRFLKERHRATLGIGIKKAYWHMGIGTLLMDEAIESARLMHYEQIELTVCANNVRAIKLYTRFGFEKRGIFPKAYKFKNGKYSDLDFMVREL